MAVKVKKKKNEEVKGEKVGMDANDHVAVELLGKFGNGKVVALHRIQAEKLIKAKKAKKSNVDIEKLKSADRTTVDI
jgi:hypothetical protein